MKKILITGASGFIGYRLSKELIKRGYFLLLLTRNYSNLKSRLDKDKINSNMYEIVEVDLESNYELKQSNIEACIHLAWIGIRGTNLTNARIQRCNIDVMLKLMDELKKCNCKLFIGAGSISQNEISSRKAQCDKERYYRCVKQFCEDMGREYAKELGMKFIWPRITNTYGIGEESPRFINSLLRSIASSKKIKMSSGYQMYDFVYIDDLINAFILIMQEGKEERRYNIGSGMAKPLKEWIEPIPSYCGENYQLKLGELEYRGAFLDQIDFSIEELVEDTGYFPRVSFEDGIKATYNWIKGDFHE